MFSIHLLRDTYYMLKRNPHMLQNLPSKLPLANNPTLAKRQIQQAMHTLSRGNAISKKVTLHTVLTRYLFAKALKQPVRKEASSVYYY